MSPPTGFESWIVVIVVDCGYTRIGIDDRGGVGWRLDRRGRMWQRRSRFVVHPNSSKPILVLVGICVGTRSSSPTASRMMIGVRGPHDGGRHVGRSSSRGGSGYDAKASIRIGGKSGSDSFRGCGGFGVE